MSLSAASPVSIPTGAPEGEGGWTREGFRAFVDREVAPFAGEWDRAERTPSEVIRRVAEAGYLGALLPREVGGAGMDTATFGVLNEELGRGCSSIRSLLTVHSMASFAVHRWGSAAQKERWLASLASGETIGAFGLSEPGAGSDVTGIETEAVADGDGYVLHGRKKWTTYGQVAGLFLVFARVEGKPLALLVERDTPGFTVEPLRGITGTRASMLAELRFDGCRVPRANRIGGPGFGTGVALSVLEVGRFSVASGCVGIIQACLDASLAYATERVQGGARLREHQLVQRMVTNMATDLRAARLLCRRAGEL
ncbi:MAG: acyl-CoA dehydrogenase family protein, partial [Gemmatimonadetes bacterium]|nr:acyl-CoA dehydrogenase family protein [Gemmatimonadota bacterium]